MTLLLCVIVLITSIIGFFSQEFIALAKRMFAIQIIALMLPLCFASLIVESYALWGWKSLTWIQSELSILEHSVANLMPFQVGASTIVRILLLFVISALPVWITWYFTRKNPLSKGLIWAQRMAAFLWVILAILMINSTVVMPVS